MKTLSMKYNYNYVINQQRFHKSMLFNVKRELILNLSKNAVTLRYINDTG